MLNIENMLQVGKNNDILRKKSEKVTNIDFKVKNIIEEMAKVMQDENGVGISACQIGYNIQVCIISLWEEKNKNEIYSGNDLIIINPEIIHKSNETYIDEEGCLSLPNDFGKVKRHKWVVLKYTNIKGKKITKKFFGLTSRIIQHEVDHLYGVLFTDKLV